jgi:hypothetical protein
METKRHSVGRLVRRVQVLRYRSPQRVVEGVVARIRDTPLERPDLIRRFLIPTVQALQAERARTAVEEVQAEPLALKPSGSQNQS